jgi:glycosyltransferase involved in cell wall biosynthesis
MRIAYVTTYDATNVHSWSGLGYFIARTLEDQGSSLQYINVGNPALAWRAYGRLRSQLRQPRYMPERAVRLAEQRANRVCRSLSHGTDLVFSPGTLAVAGLPSAPPFVFWADATFAALIDFYPGFNDLDPRTIEQGHEVERRALERCAAAIYASEWAARSAINDYGADTGKVYVVPFGANLDALPTEEQAYALIARRPRDSCRLLFLGVDWERKGGALAVEAARILNQRGLPTELFVVGCEPPSVEDFVRVSGFISKKGTSGQLQAHLAEAHFLILPSRAECYGVVFAEASAYGVPSLATSVGGVPTAVRHGSNGALFDLSSGPAVYADFVESAMPHYEFLAQQSVREYHDRLNWSTSGLAVQRILDAVVGG